MLRAMSGLKDKVVLITGASSGIGEGTAVHFAKLGARLSLAGRSVDNLSRVAGLCQGQGLSENDVLTVAGDINKKDDRQTLIQSTIDKFGKLDVLVNNAGMAHYTSVGETTPEVYDEVMDTNARSHVFLTQLALPHLIKTKGNIVNTSSVCGPKPMPEVGVYCMSKAAMDMFTQCLALEMAPHGVRVNSINPGTIVSNIARRSHSRFQEDSLYQQFLEKQKEGHPLGRVGLPEDCAEAVAFLASDSSSFITGQILFIDGGRHCVSAGVATNVKK